MFYLHAILPTSPFPSTGESQKEKIHSILKKTKVPYQGSWRKVFQQTYSLQSNNKEQTGTVENLFSVQNLTISFIGFVIVPVMCIPSFFQSFLNFTLQPYFSILLGLGPHFSQLPGEGGFPSFFQYFLNLSLHSSISNLPGLGPHFPQLPGGESAFQSVFQSLQFSSHCCLIFNEKVQFLGVFGLLVGNLHILELEVHIQSLFSFLYPFSHFHSYLLIFLIF